MAKEGYEYCMVDGKIYVGDEGSIHPKIEVKLSKEETELDRQIEAKRKELCDLMDEKRKAYYASKEEKKAKEEKAKEEELEERFKVNAELWFKLYQAFMSAGFQSNQAFKLCTGCIQLSALHMWRMKNEPC